jgi:glyoxylase-like metal-dependent hydrolase (beta-lactamase superfamily II)
MQIVKPYPNIFAFYDGRIPGVRAHSPEQNWLDDGAFTLGTASFAIVEGAEAIVYDAHMSLIHARMIRDFLEGQGVRDMRLVVSHWHTDHVAGNAVFSDCEVIANRFTKEALIANRDELENNDPPIKPLIMPNRIFDSELELRVGDTVVELRHLDIHSYDETVALLPQSGVLLAGDTLEDTVTYVSEPDRLEQHLVDLARMESWDFESILPNHGTLERITSGGYDRTFITATRLYVEKLLRLKDEPELADLDMRSFAAEALATGGVEYFEAYEPVHANNVKSVLASIRKAV